MVIEVRFFAALRRYTPDDPSGIISVDVPDNQSVEELLREMEVNPEDVKNILRNGKESHLSDHLADGDRLDLFPANGSK